MNTSFSSRLLLAVIFLFSATLSVCFSQAVVIVNKKNSTSALSSNQLKDLYLGDASSFPNGSAATVVFSKEENDARKKMNALLGKSQTQINAIWMKKALNDGVKAPPQLSSAEDIIEFVAKNPGAIGYVPAGTSLPATVKAVSINGKGQID